jgi:hypothetical protein
MSIKKKHAIICVICGKEHMTAKKDCKSCLDCKSKLMWQSRIDRAVLVEKKCVVCDAPFVIKGKINSDKVCCSPKCGRVLSWRNGSREKGEKVVKLCPVCNKEFTRMACAERVTNVKHCSRKCYGKSKQKPDTYIELKCSTCKKVFSKRKDHLSLKGLDFCSRDCSTKNKTIEGALWRDKEYIANYHRNYAHMNRPAFALYQKERKTNIAKTKDKMTTKEWTEVLELYDHKCLKCGTSENITMDHIMPIFLGGEHKKENIQPLCKSCNSSKRLKIIDYRPKQI